MTYAIQWIRSLVFNSQMYIMMAIVGVGFLPWALIDRRGGYACVHFYIWWVRWTASWMVGLKTEIRGSAPTGEVLVAGKHQSFLDVMLIAGAVPHPKFIMKQELRFVPIVGWYGAILKCIPVKRGRRSEAIKKMMRDLEKGDHVKGQLCIYPQGTRVSPGEHLPYKVGTAVLYLETGMPCVPVATNVGVFWSKLGVYRKPGVAIVEFLDPIQPGLDKEEFLAVLEDKVETASDALLTEAGFIFDDTPKNSG